MDVEKLEKLNELKEKGILTQDEFEEQKQILLKSIVITTKPEEKNIESNFDKPVDDTSYMRLDNTTNIKDDYRYFSSQENSNSILGSIFSWIVVAIFICIINYKKLEPIIQDMGIDIESIIEDFKVPIMDTIAQEVDDLTGINSLNEKQLSHYCVGVAAVSMFDVSLISEEFLAGLLLPTAMSSVIMFGEDEENSQQKAFDDILKIAKMEKAPQYSEYIYKKCDNHLEKVMKQLEKEQKQKEYIFDKHNILNLLRE